MITKQIKPEVLIAVDPGVTGAIAVLCRSKISTYPLKNKTDDDIISFFSDFADPFEAPVVAYMERVGGFIPKGEDGEGQPGSRMFTFGDANGFMRGVLKTYGIPLKLVMPQVWQKGISGPRRTYAERKRTLHAHATRLFPDLDFGREEADALGILHYARFVELGENAGYGAAVAVLDLPLADQMAQAVKWCVSQGWPVPAPRTPERASMFDYWRNVIVARGAA